MTKISSFFIIFAHDQAGVGGSIVCRLLEPLQRCGDIFFYANAFFVKTCYNELSDGTSLLSCFFKPFSCFFYIFIDAVAGIVNCREFYLASV